MRTAAANIRRVASVRCRRVVDVPVAGVTIAQRVVPLDRVGCYVPGGRYPLPSSLLMRPSRRGSPASRKSSRCARDPIPWCSLPRSRRGSTGCSGSAARTASRAGLRNEDVPRVDKIVGPGNAYVAAAKALVAGDCAIDFFAGPSEIAIVSTRAGRSGLPPI